MSTNRIFYSIALNIGLMLFIDLYLQVSKKIFKIFIFVMALLIVFSILLLGSRAGVLALVINFIILFVYFGKGYAKYKYIILSTILSSGILIMSYMFIPQVKYRINMAFSDLNKVYTAHNYNSSLGIRIGLYETSTKLLFEDKCSMVCGLGYGDAKLKFKNYLEKNSPDKAFIERQPHVHNQYLQTWIDGGLLAMFLYIAMLIVLGRLKIPYYDKLGLYGFVSSFAVLGFSDIIYHRGVVLGLFAFGIGFFLYLEQYFNEINRQDIKL
jgi:O-antigen ligase